MRIVKDHGMAKQGAKDTVDALLPTLVKRHGDSMSSPTGAWRGDVFEFSFEARGFRIKGTLEVSDTRVTLDARLPFLARPFEGMIRSNIERELDQILDQ
jgi:putative polyhydroxyalkanoate system protein